MCCYAAWRYRQRRWAAVGLALIASGPLVGVLSDSREQALAWHVSLMAGALIASGAAAFASYRRLGKLPK